LKSSIGLIFALCAKITAFSANRFFITANLPVLLKKTVQSPATGTKAFKPEPFTNR